MKRWVKAGLAAAAILLVFFLSWQQMDRRILVYNLKGTYAAGDQVSDSARYLTFLEDGRYFRYCQGELLEHGSFSMREKGIFTLVAEDGTRGEILALGNGTVYQMEEGLTSAYVRLTSTPAFVDLSVDLKSLPQQNQ